jgi:hypothetical protein
MALPGNYLRPSDLLLVAASGPNVVEKGRRYHAG